MTSFVLNSTSTTERTLVDGEEAYVGPDGMLATIGTAIDGAGNVNFMIEGSVYSSTNDAIEIDGTRGLGMIGDSGSVSSLTGYGLRVTMSDDYYLENAGEIHAYGMAVLLSGPGSSSFAAFNDGTIFSRNYYGIFSTPGLSGDTRITNDGRIAAPAPIYVTTGTLELHNSGLLSALGERSINHFAIYSSNVDDWIENTGSIDGLVRTNSGNDYFLNSGDMDDILLGNGDDILINDGGKIGDVEGGADNDDITNTNGGSMMLVNLGSGDDSFDGRGGQSGTVLGGAGNDTLIGGANEDDLQGGTEDDVLKGKQGDDTLSGDDGDDILVGGGDDDILIGGVGNDRLLGGRHDDILDGGSGKDVMTGGAGADVFDFNDASESPVDFASADIITDFTPGEDLIDLSDVAAGVLTFSATGSYVAGVPGVKLASFSSDTMIYVDVDGNGVTDMRIILSGVVASSLSADDFIL